MIVTAIAGGIVFLIFWAILPMAVGRMAQQLYEKTERPRR